MTDLFDVVLLLALPASGKSEVRKYLAQLSPESCRSDFHMGPTVQLDDFPYVHLMRRIDEELTKQGLPGRFFQAHDKPFADPWDWGTLIQLLNEDFADLMSGQSVVPAKAAPAFFERLDQAAVRAGATPKLGSLEPRVRDLIALALEDEVMTQWRERHESYPADLTGRTIVIEFARGGAHGSSLPLKAPFGYQHSLAQLAPDILKRASILYIRVTPEESRRKNEARTDPNDPGSILHHGVPIAVMMGDYGCDDMAWLLEQSDRADTVRVDVEGEAVYIPTASFDNVPDKTSFIRNARADWTDDEVGAIHSGLSEAARRLAAARDALA